MSNSSFQAFSHEPGIDSDIDNGFIIQGETDSCGNYKSNNQFKNLSENLVNPTEAESMFPVYPKDYKQPLSDIPRYAKNQYQSTDGLTITFHSQSGILTQAEVQAQVADAGIDMSNNYADWSATFDDCNG